MTQPLDVVALIGSLRRDSLTKRLVFGLIEVAPRSLHIEIVPLAELSMYNEDLEDQPPPSWIDLRARIQCAAAVLIATPEYNRSVPAVLKNALDVGSRPYGKNVWAGKPAAVVSASPGAMGAFGANHHLRQALTYLDMPTMQQPEAYIGGVDKMVDENGHFINDSARQFCTTVMDEFERWILRFVNRPAP